MFPHPSLIIFFFTLFPILSVCQNIQQFNDCSTKFYNCGQANQWIGYPFWGNDRSSYCGLPEFHLTCREDNVTTLRLSNTTLRVLRIEENDRRIILARDDLWRVQDVCLLETVESINSTTFDYTVFSYIVDRYLFLGLHFSCSEDDVRIRNTPARNRLNCSESEDERVSFFEVGLNDYRGRCEREIRLPVSRNAFDEFNQNENMAFVEVLIEGFPVEYRVDGGGICSRCESSGGTCWSGLNSTVPSCLCSDGVSRLVCNDSGSGISWNRKIAVGVISGILGVFIMCIVFYIWRRRHNMKKRYYRSSYTSRNISSYTSSTKDLEKNEGYHGVQIFKYRELEKATNYFDPANELGDGGFGTVYKGKLKDERIIAVKRLYENNYRRVAQFMNEIGILAHLRHPNLVSLYGSTTCHSRELLLVYEYIPNGTVADHLHGQNPSLNPPLPWTTRINIAIETANALVYLHASDVIHRDVKTNNILLDNSFTVKVADFGLSRLFPNNVTHVSTAPQGTPGYVDPEYHECYQLTNKSDVYSFGVVLIELISSKPAVDITRHRHEINLSNMAVNMIREDRVHELVDSILGYEDDHGVRKMVNGVAELAFQCLQSERDCRPSMEEVLEGLISIRDGRYNQEKQGDVEGTCDDAVLLENRSQNISPDSVVVAWSSSTNVSISSG